MSLFRKVSRALEARAFNTRKKVARRLILGPEGRNRQSPPSAPFNRTQELFIRWNAERLGLTLEESRRRYLQSWNTVSGGHRGVGFEIFMYLNQEIFSVFFGNNDDELFDTYNFHGYRDLLRQMIFPEPEFGPGHPVVTGLEDLQEISILDFGCGLAQRSRFLADYLKGQGKQVRLYLADIPSIAEPFLVWMGEQSDVETVFLPCTRENPIPAIPECHVLVATEFFEHVSNPVEYFHRFDEKLQAKGFLWTDVADHEEGFLHVSPDLSELRGVLAERGYVDIEPHVILRKG